MNLIFATRNNPYFFILSLELNVDGFLVLLWNKLLKRYQNSPITGKLVNVSRKTVTFIEFGYGWENCVILFVHGSTRSIRVIHLCSILFSRPLPSYLVICKDSEP
jgi:hypothetical protein